MSAPRGPRGATRGRGRGTARGGANSRNSSDDESKKNNARRTRFSSEMASAPLLTTKQLKPPPTQNGFHNSRAEKNMSTTISQHRGSPIAGRSFSAATSDQNWRDPTLGENASYQKRMTELYQTLKKNREKERKDAIRNGFLSDPEKPTSLANAITPVGTCLDMCPEFERVERIVQLMVDGCEKTSCQSSETKVPCEEYMIKRFRRSAAGYDEQLPSDIRPPLVLQKTLNYLLDQVVGGSQPLANVHKFVWDRTRGIRNDFSIQQVTKTEDLRIAIDCFERIARFHILSLHQLSRPGEDNGDFDHHQEREQLNNALLSLMYYYDDSRHKLASPNEAEFRAYCIIFEIQDQRPDLEDRAQNWPRPLLRDPRVQTALNLYAAAGNTADEQGPLRPRAAFCVAQSDYGRFFSIVKSNTVSYLMACVAEIYFNLVRNIALDAIWKAYKRGASTRTEDLILVDLAVALGFDNEDEVQAFCEDHGFSIREREDGEAYLDLTSIVGRFLSDSNSRRKQIFSKSLVEQKRLGRTLPAVINGIRALQAQSDDLVEDTSAAGTSPPFKADNESLFISGDSDEEPSVTAKKPGKSENRDTLKTAPKFNPFAQPFSTQPPIAPFGATNTLTSSTSSGSNSPFSTSPTITFSKPTFPPHSTASLNLTPANTSNPSSVSGTPSTTNPNPFKPTNPPKFNFFAPSSTTLPKPTANDLPPPKTTLHPNSILSFSSSPSTPTTPSMTDTSKAKTPSIEVTQQSGTTSTQGKAPNPPTAPFQFFPQSKQPPPSLPFSSTPPELPDISSSEQPPSISAPTNGIAPSLTNAPNPFSAFFPPKQQQSTTSSISTERAQEIEPPSLKFPSFLPGSLSPPNVMTPSAPIHSTPLMPQVEKAAPVMKQPLTNADSSNTPHSRLSVPPSTDRSASTTQTPKPTPRTKDFRPRAIDALSKTVLLEEEGLLQQFIEHTLGPIIRDAFYQRKDERSWERAHEVRQVLLGRKYVRRWKEVAWKLGLLRKGRERRRNLAQSMQVLARSSRQRRGANNDLGETHTSKDRTEDDITQPPRITTMPPPPTPMNGQQKRKSLPVDINPQYSPILGQSSNDMSQCQGKSSRTGPASSRIIKVPKGHHKRSSTVGDAGLNYRSWKASSSNSSSMPVGPNSFLSESTMANARHLLADTPTDTTRTDYFRLKAMGIDPDTPSVPDTSNKRTRNEVEMKAKKVLKLSPTDRTKYLSLAKSDTPQNIGQPPPPKAASRQVVDDPDEELLAQMRRVREAMSESIGWFQQERAKSEFSQSSSERRPETAKEKRLREWAPTPSRTEQRLATTGGHGLAPKEFGVSRNTLQPAEGRANLESRMSQPQGFAAMTTGFNPVVAVDNRVGGDRESSQDHVAKGTSVEDAIEL